MPTVHSAEEVHYDQMQNHMRKNKVGESAFRRNAIELGLVLRVRLQTQAHWKMRKCQ